MTTHLAAVTKTTVAGAGRTAVARPPRALATKRAIDVGVALLLLLATLPLLLLIATAIRLETRGPILFRQRRHGLGKRTFLIMKFRTMRHGPDLERQARRGDDRITRVGRFLRRSSLDELPQLLNVVKGDMSLVGPRPHPLWLDERFEPEIPLYTARFAMPPGITGLAQVNGCRGETPDVEFMARRIAWDVHYINEWTPAMDIRILVRTLAVLWADQRAY